MIFILLETINLDNNQAMVVQDQPERRKSVNLFVVDRQNQPRRGSLSLTLV